MATDLSKILITTDSIKTKLLHIESVNVNKVSPASVTEIWQIKEWSKGGSTNKHIGRTLNVPNKSTRKP